MTPFRLSPVMSSPFVLAAMTSLMLFPLILSAVSSSPWEFPVPTLSSASIGTPADRA